jgi:hypothetical protein
VGRIDEWVAECMHKHHHGNVVRIQRVSDGRVLRIIDRRMPDGHTVGFRIDLTDIARAKEAAEAASQAKSDFIATVSHELRTPLQSILGYSELAAQFAADAGQQQFRGFFLDVHAGGQRMLAMVNELLDIFKLQSDPGTLRRQDCDLLELAREVVRELQPQAQGRNVAMALAHDMPALPAYVEPARLQQVLRNVLANALRFAPGGSVVELSGAVLPTGGLQLSVRDHGPGIPDDELESVFEAFRQSSRTRSTAGGTGLGLTISRRIMVAHGGSLTAHNAPGGGTLMRILLPPPSPAALAVAPPCPTPS